MELKTERLYIRNLYETDWEEMKNIWIDFSSSKYAVYDAPLPTEEGAAKALTKKFAESKMFFAVFPKASGDMLGYICFHQDKNTYDLGYCFKSSYHGRGYAYESCDLLIKYFQEKYNAVIFTAGTAIDNSPSCRLLEKLGFRCVETETVSFDGDFSFQGGKFVLT